jgi:hypothetical protein
LFVGLSSVWLIALRARERESEREMPFVQAFPVCLLLFFFEGEFSISTVAWKKTDIYFHDRYIYGTTTTREKRSVLVLTHFVLGPKIMQKRLLLKAEKQKHFFVAKPRGSKCSQMREKVDCGEIKKGTERKYF